MRSELVFAAEHTLPNRYSLCRLVSTATRKFHRPNTRIEETTDVVLRHIANASARVVKLNSTEIEQNNRKVWGEVGLGGTYAWNDKWSVYGEASYATALSSHGGNQNYNLKGTAGLRYRW